MSTLGYINSLFKNKEQDLNILLLIVAAAVLSLPVAAESKKEIHCSSGKYLHLQKKASNCMMQKAEFIFKQEGIEMQKLDSGSFVNNYHNSKGIEILERGHDNGHKGEHQAVYGTFHCFPNKNKLILKKLTVKAEGIERNLDMSFTCP